MKNAAPDFNQAVHFDLTLRPSRSMTGTGRKAFYGSLLAAGALSNIFAIKAGIWPVAVTIDLALAGLAAAMIASDRSGREYQILRLTDEALEIRHYRPEDGAETVRRLSPYMLKVRTERDFHGNCTRLLLASHGRQTEIGAFLPPAERAKFAIIIENGLKQVALPHHLRGPQPKLPEVK